MHCVVLLQGCWCKHSGWNYRIFGVSHSLLMLSFCLFVCHKTDHTSLYFIPCFLIGFESVVLLNGVSVADHGVESLTSYSVFLCVCLS